MRFTNVLAGLLFTLAGSIAVLVDTTPAPPAITVQAQTPDSVRVEMARERKQKRYDVATKVAMQVYRRRIECQPFAGIIGQLSVDNDVPVRVLAALSIVESSCNPNAVNKVTKDFGLMQLNKKYHPQYTTAELLNPFRNAQIAAGELRHLIRSFGLVQGLHHYNGLGTPDHPTDNSYAAHVLAVAGLHALAG